MENTIDNVIGRQLFSIVGAILWGKFANSLDIVFIRALLLFHLTVIFSDNKS